MNIKTNKDLIRAIKNKKFVKDLIRAIKNKKFVDVIIDKEGQYHVVFSKDVTFTETFVRSTLLESMVESMEDDIASMVPSYQRFIKNG